MSNNIYLDNAATTKIAPEVAETMMACFSDYYANPSSNHPLGQEVRSVLEKSRETIAGYINCRPKEIIFTSGGTESDNTAILGIAKSFRRKGNHIITSKIEHKAILSACHELEKQGFNVTYVEVDSQGVVDPEEIERSICHDTILISIMLVNNEIGIIQPIAEISRCAREHGILMHTDAVQALGKLTFDIKELGIDLLSISAHKIHGPKGIGALYLRNGIKIGPMLVGGIQEFGQRAGTENVPGIVGFAKAIELIETDFIAQITKMRGLRDQLEQGLLDKIDGITINGKNTNRVPSILNASFKYIEGDYLLRRLHNQGICVSSGSACFSHSLEPSHVLLATGVSAGLARNSVRFSLSRNNTRENIDQTLNALIRIQEEMAGVSSGNYS